MKQKEFKEKYSGNVVYATYPMSSGSLFSSQEVSQKTEKLKHICEKFGLRVMKLPEMANLGAFKINFLIVELSNQKSKYSGVPNVSFSIEEFIEDFEHIKKEEEEMTDEILLVIDILRSFSIKYNEIEKRSDYFTSKQANEEGFIQSHTSSEASLWWHTKGDILLFVRCHGVFTIK